MPPTPASIAAALGIVVTAASLAGPARSSPPSGPPPPRFTAADSLRWRTFALEDEGIAPTQASADSLAKLLSDPDPAVRSRAILNLRRLASTFRRSGVVRVPREPQFPPLVEGLVPRLVAAATDTDSSVKKGALFALADTKDPEARKALRAHLADPDSGCRFTAACLLTEFGDDSGLEELGRALDRLAAPDEAPEPRHDFDAEMLLAALPRITGVSLGPVPPQPSVLSSMAAAEESRHAYTELLRAWAEWWKEHPPAHR